MSAYSGCERSNGKWSCQLLCAKNLLTPQGWTTPQTELHALSSLANLSAVLLSALSEWVEVLHSGSDSSIAISWTAYEKVRLHIFHRLRVSNIRNKIDLGELYHVSGKENVADIGTRPELLKVEQLLPGSEWLCGKEWMKEPVQDVVKSGVIKTVSDIKLDNDAKKLLKEGIMLDSSLNSVVKCDKAILSQKVIEREKFSNYIFPPLKWRFPKFVRIVSWTLLAVRKFKLNMVKAREIKGLTVSDGSTSESLILPPPKFSVFNAFSVISENKSSLSKVFNVSGFEVNTSHGVKHARLSDAALSVSLDYIYKKAGAEVLKFNDRKYVERIGEVVDGIVYCKSRIEESQALRAVGGLEDILDLQTFTGVSFRVPVIDRHSPIAISLAYYLHYYVVKHRGSETVHRLSLKYVRIIGSRSLMKLIRDECIFCRKLFLKYVKQFMGPLSDHQLSISPVFFYTLADLWGPLRAYAPGHQRNTRTGDKTYDIYMIVFGCAATGTINCQVLEGGKATSNMLDALNRFFAEACVPKIFFIDKDSALVKALSEGELEILSNDGTIAVEKGIKFVTCPPQGHSAHGRIERRIKMVQESFERSEMKKFKLTGLGWQTVAKRVEFDVNSIPLGYLSHREDNVHLLRILTPNFLKLNAGANRSPSSLFTLPTSSADLMSRIENAYQTFYKVWNECYVPLIARSQRWFEGDENLCEGDIIYFKLRDSVLSSEWLVGKVEQVFLSKDKKVRKILVGYKFDSEQGVRQFRVVERPVREVIKLLSVDDTSLLEDIRAVRSASKFIVEETDLPVQAASNVAISHSRPLVTYGCNQSGLLGPVFKSASIDIGTHAIHETDADACYGCEIGQTERDLGLETEINDMIFDIENDTYDYDNKFDNDLLLL